MSDHPESTLAFLLRNGGLGLALHGFFDETGTHSGHPITGVAGFLYDDSSLKEFETRWRKRTFEFAKPFHTTDCHGGRDQFEGWPKPLRLQLMHDLADIIASTKIAGFVAFAEKDEWEQWSKINQRGIVERFGSPYSACLLHCISMVRDFTKANYPEDDVFYLFEAGCDRQREAEDFLFHLERNERTRIDLRLRGHGFVSRTREPALCAADFIAWEWQRNYVECLEDEANNRKGYWRSEFKILLDSKNLYFKALVDGSFSVRALINAFNATQPKR